MLRRFACFSFVGFLFLMSFERSANAQWTIFDPVENDTYYYQEIPFDYILSWGTGTAPSSFDYEIKRKSDNYPYIYADIIWEAPPSTPGPNSTRRLGKLKLGQLPANGTEVVVTITAKDAMGVALYTKSIVIKVKLMP